MRCSLLFLLLAVLPVRALAAPQSFLERYCHDCHDADSKKGNLDLTVLGFAPETADVWIKIHDVVEQGEMPPKKKTRPEQAAKSAFLAELDGHRHAGDRPGAAAQDDQKGV